MVRRLASKILGQDHQVGDAGLVFQRDEHHALGGAGALADQHDARHLAATTVAGSHRFHAGDHPAAGQVVAQEGHRVTAQRQAGMAMILDHLAPDGHRAQSDGRLGELRWRCARLGGDEERQVLVGQPLQVPQRIAASEAQGRAEAVGLASLRGGTASSVRLMLQGLSVHARARPAWRCFLA